MTSPTENILALADFIASEKYKFDMGEGAVKLECGSAGCIGGHASVLWPEVSALEYPNLFAWDEEKLADKLGINPDDADYLCFPPSTINYSRVTREHAIKVLKRLAETGEVNWDDVVEEISRHD